MILEEHYHLMVIEVEQTKSSYTLETLTDSFFKDMHDMYPGIQRDFDRNIELAAQEYQRRTDNRLFGIVANAINVRREDINFKNLAYYLDDYVCAFANNMNVNPFNFDAKTHEMISEYFVYLIKHGMLRDPALNKVIAHPFLYSALREIMFKAQNSRELNSWEGPCVTNKVSLSFGNRLTFLAALEVLNLDHDAVYNPGWGDQLTFELFEDNNQLFVRILVNNNLITHIQRDGIIPINQFIEYLCSRLYFGDMSRVEQGLENYHEKAEIIGGSCQSLPQEEPLFGCKRKQNNSQCPYYNRQLGSSENDVNTDDGSNQYFDDDSSYIDEGDNMNPDDTSEMDNNNYRYMGAVESEVKHMLAKPSNRSGRRINNQHYHKTKFIIQN